MADKTLIQSARDMYRAGLNEQDKWRERGFRTGQMVSKAISDFSLRKQRQDQFDESMRMRQQTIDMSQQRLDYYINRDAEIRRENVQKREYEVASMFDQMTSSIGNNPTEGGIITEIQKAFVENETNNANKSIDNQQYVSTRVGLESRLRKMGGGIGQYVSFMKEMFSADPLTPGATFNISNLSKSNEEEQRMIDLLIPGNSQRGYDAKGDLYFDAKWNGVDVSRRYWATDLAPKLQQVDQAGRGLSLGYGEFDETLRANARNGKDVGDVSQIFSSTIIAGKDGNLTETWKNARSFVDDMELTADSSLMDTPDWLVQQERYRQWYNTGKPEDQQIGEDNLLGGNHKYWHRDEGYSGRGKPGTDLIQWTSSHVSNHLATKYNPVAKKVRDDRATAAAPKMDFTQTIGNIESLVDSFNRGDLAEFGTLYGNINTGSDEYSMLPSTETNDAGEEELTGGFQMFRDPGGSKASREPMVEFAPFQTRGTAEEKRQEFERLMKMFSGTEFGNNYANLPDSAKDKLLNFTSDTEPGGTPPPQEASTLTLDQLNAMISTIEKQKRGGVFRTGADNVIMLDPNGEPVTRDMYKKFVEQRNRLMEEAGIDKGVDQTIIENVNKEVARLKKILDETDFGDGPNAEKNYLKLRDNHIRLLRNIGTKANEATKKAIEDIINNYG